MTDEDSLLLAELLCARICHDLAGPVGAVGTGAELLTEEGGTPGLASEALDLLASSAASAGARLRFLRLALGAGGASVAAGQLRDLANSFLTASAGAHEAVRLDWRDDGLGPWEAGEAKLLLNLVLLGRDCLPRGGAMEVRARTADGALARVTVAGPGVGRGEAAQGVGAQSPAGLGPRSAQGYYAKGLASRLGLTIRDDVGTDRIVFAAVRDNDFAGTAAHSS